MALVTVLKAPVPPQTTKSWEGPSLRSFHCMSSVVLQPLLTAMTGWEEETDWEFPQLETPLVPPEEAPLTLRTRRKAVLPPHSSPLLKWAALSWEVG